jgi:hypothetical protein
MGYIDDSDYQKYDNTNNVRKAPTGLMVLCVLTFIGSGFSALTYFLSFLLYDTLTAMMLQMADTMGGVFATYYSNAADMFSSTSRYLFLLMAISCLLSITGSGCMVKMRKVGFHLYVAGQILLIGLPIILMTKGGFSFFEAVLSIVFIALYGSYLKKMR